MKNLSNFKPLKTLEKQQKLLLLHLFIVLTLIKYKK